VFEVGNDVADAEHPHGKGDEADAVAELRDLEGEARHARIHVRADEAEQEAEQDHAERVQQRAMRQHDGGDEAEHHQREILGGTEFQGEGGQGRGKQRDHESGDRAGEEGADRRRGERPPRLALPRHLMAVEGGHYGRGLAGQVDQDGRGRPAVLRAVEDPGEHDQGRRRRQSEGDRQQHGDGGDRAEAGQHADRRAEENADQAVEEVGRTERGLETEAEIGEHVHGVTRPATAARKAPATRRSGASARRAP
jgi:hypothetical protein